MIEVNESDYVERAKVDELVLGFNTHFETKKGHVFYSLNFKSSVTLKKVIATEGGPKYGILDTREVASNETMTEGGAEKAIEEARADVGSFLAEHCMPLLEQLVQDLPSCAIR